MPDVIFRSIKCTETTAGWGSDTVAIYFKGERIFYEEMDSGDARTIGDGNTGRHFTGSETIWVKEIDSGSDDIIGTINVSGNGCGEQQATMYGDDSHYDLWYAVGGAP